MSVGSIYENMEVFKLAIAQHTIKKKFEFNIEKVNQGDSGHIVQERRRGVDGGYMLQR